MANERLFNGSGLSAVDTAGRTRLPTFIQQALIARSGCRNLLIGAHESDGCIAGFDHGHAIVVHAELERRRLAGEAAGEAPEAHHARARRMFGLAEEAQFDIDGVVTLPPLPRRLGGIGGLALFVGTGGAFEIWDPSRARERGGEELRALAEYRLAQHGYEQEGDAE